MIKKINLDKFDDLISSNNVIDHADQTKNKAIVYKKITHTLDEYKFRKLKAYCLKNNKKLKEVIEETIDKLIENINIDNL